jgi:hypothetical protein
MKKIFQLILISLFCINLHAQKKNKSVAKNIKTNVLAKVDNVTIEIVKNNFNLYVLNGKIKDSINIKTIANVAPTECKLTSFSSKGNKLYMLTYNEISTTQTTNKTELLTATNCEIFDIGSKSKVFSNVQKSTKITEKVFLDRLKNASETQEKMRNEGFVVSLLPDGDLSLKTKTQENKMTYDIISKKYVDFKKKK